MKESDSDNVSAGTKSKNEESSTHSSENNLGINKKQIPQIHTNINDIKNQKYCTPKGIKDYTNIPVYYRKMSSPICDYYNSSQKVLSKIFGQENTSLSNFDYTKSNNYITKEKLYNSKFLQYSSKFKNYQNSFYPDYYDEYNTNNYLYAQNFGFYNNANRLRTVSMDECEFRDKDKLEKDKEKKLFNLNSPLLQPEGEHIPITPSPNSMNNDYNKFVFKETYTNMLQNQLNLVDEDSNVSKDNTLDNNSQFTENSSANGNFLTKLPSENMSIFNNYGNLGLFPRNIVCDSSYNMNYCYRFKNNKDNNNQNSAFKNYNFQKKSKCFVEREGDWICVHCKNLNFSFRAVCNRCGAQKAFASLKGESKNNKTLVRKTSKNDLNQNNKSTKEKDGQNWPKKVSKKDEKNEKNDSLIKH